MAQENTSFQVGAIGPGPTQGLLRFVLIEGVEDSGVFNLTFEQASLDSATYPSQESGLVAATSRISGLGSFPTLVTAAVGPIVLTAANAGQVSICTLGSGNQTFTLPSAVNNGLTFTFICGNAAGEILVNPATGLGQNFIIKASEGGAAVTTAANTGIKNTAATNVLDDRITVISDGIGTWYAINQSGIWASQ